MEAGHPGAVAVQVNSGAAALQNIEEKNICEV